ncbi:MAG: hypothetical protein JSS43_16485, partial [Proteobacteria bacterium]|nr:hypothetical protein [Pseudomonadota bacterium]
QVHGFVGQSGGWVELSSTPGHGTTISMFLPRAGDREEGWPEDRVVRAIQPEPSAGGVSEADSRAESEQAYRELRQRSDMRGTRALPLQSRRQDSAPVVARIPVQDLENTIQTSVRIAVAPLRAIGSDADRDIAVGFAEELTAALSRFRWISCVAPLSVSALSDNSPAGAANWRALELDYLINGSLYRTDDKVRITIRLISQRQRGEIAWTKDYASDLIDILRLQDDIAAETAAQVGPELLIWEGERAAARAQVDPSSYALVLRAIPAVYRLDEAGFRAAGQLLNEAVTADPSSAAAHSWLAHWYLLLIGQGWSKDIPRTAAIAHEHAVCAIKLDPGDARGLTVAGHVEAFLYKRPMQALRLHDLALNRNPNLALAWCYAGLANSYVGRHAEAIEHIRRAQRLSPHDPHRFFFDTCMVMPLLLTGDYDNAARIGRRAVAANPALSSAHKGLISTLGLMGRVAEAQEFREQLEALEPRFSVEDAISRSPLTQPVDLQRYAEGLRRAGCRERLRRIPFQRQLKPIGWRTRPPDARADAS